MGEIQLQELGRTGDAQPRPRINAVSLLIFVCSFFLLFLVCLPVLRRNLITTDAVSGVYWESGLAAARGTNPYVAYPGESVGHLTILGVQRDVLDLNLNPPCMLLVFQAFSHLPFTRFSLAWTVGSILLLLGTVAMLMWRCPGMQKRKILWLLLAAPIFDTLLSANLYFILFFLAALALVFWEHDHELAAAIAIGFVVAIKPTTVLWPLFLYLAGHRRLGLRSLAVMLAVSAAPILFYGPSIYRDWLAAFANDPHWIFPSNVAIPAYFERLGFPFFGLILAGTLAVLLAWTVWKTKPTFTEVSGIALCAAILCAPFAWVDYVLMVAPYFVSRRWRLPSNLAAVLLAVPSFVPGTISGPAGRQWVALGSGIYFAAVWIMLAGFVSHGVRKPPVS